MYNDELTLITYLPGKDEIGNPTRQEIRSTVLCQVKSVGERTFYSAGTEEKRPEIKFIVHRFEYGSQKTVEYDGQKYEVIRTYFENQASRYSNLSFDEIELTCARVVGNG